MEDFIEIQITCPDCDNNVLEGRDGSNDPDKGETTYGYECNKCGFYKQIKINTSKNDNQNCDAQGNTEKEEDDNVPVGELYVGEEHNCKYKDMPTWFYPSGTDHYQIVELASTAHLPHSKAIEVTVKESENSDLDLQLGLHQYGYNVGENPLTINWELNGNSYTETLNPGDTIYIKPFVKHNFRGSGKLLLLRIGGRMAGEPQREF